MLEELLKRIDGLEKRLGENEGGGMSMDSPEPSSTSSVASRKRPHPDIEQELDVGPPPSAEMAPPPTITPDERLIPKLVDVFFERVNGKPYTLFHEGLFRQDWAAGRIPSYILNSVCAVSVRWVSGGGYDF